MRKNACVLGLFSLWLISGCAVRPVFGPAQATLDILGARVMMYDEQNPLIGEIVYRGIEGLKVEVVINLDGKYIASLEVRGMQERFQVAGVHNFGRHVVSGEVFWVRDNGTKKRIGCFRQEFSVSAFYRNAAYYWWRVDIYPYECY